MHEAPANGQKIGRRSEKGHWDPLGEVHEAPALLEVAAAEAATGESALSRSCSGRAPWGCKGLCGARRQEEGVEN